MPTRELAQDVRLGLGCMRLSTAPDRDDEASLRLLHVAFDAGASLLDTADVYCRDQAELGHNERLIARALASWPGDRTRVHVATKGGLTRPGGRWVPDGRARQLARACEQSLRALACERLFLYQLHAPDPRVPLATSVRALDRLQRDGLVEQVGVSNVSLRQLEEALRAGTIAAVQVELSVLRDECLWNGVAARCLAEGIALLAHRPLGGPEGRKRLAREPVLVELAERHGATPSEVALAWLRHLSPRVLPLPGPTRLETLRSCVRAAGLALDASDRERLERRFPGARVLRGERARPAVAVPARSGEVVLVVGLPAAGKSTLAETLVRAGYERLNRDERGGRLASLVPALERRLAEGRTRVVLDNTYPTRKSRAGVVAAAAAQGVPVRCVFLDTPLEQAQLNAVERMLRRHGRLLEPAELRAASKQDPGSFGPDVLFRYERQLEPPDASEGFARIDHVRFERRRDPASDGRALVVWLDAIVWRARSGRRTPRSPEDLVVDPGRAQRLRRWASEGVQVVGLTWQPELESGTLPRESVEGCIAVLRREVGASLEVLCCPHAAGPPRCWCRKPLPGHGVELVLRHRLDPARCLYVGSGGLDRRFAARLGFDYREADEFFAG